jgi:hypothetical protein
MQNNKPNKRLTAVDKNYKRPDKTYQDTLTNKEIKDKLKDYKKCSDIKTVSIGSHLRYFTTNANNEKVFRLGGTLNRIDPEGRFVILGNGAISWSVQTGGTQFWQKLSETELKEELKEELRDEIRNELKKELSDDSNSHIIEKENKNLKKELKLLYKKLEILETEKNALTKKNENLSTQLDKIANEIKKKKSK